jgi:hypothetical protein
MMATRAKVSWPTRINNLEPLVTRGSIVTVIGVVGMVLNMHFSDGGTQYVVNIILSAFGLLTAVISRSKVTPNAKVTAFVEDPYTTPRSIYGEGQV